MNIKNIIRSSGKEPKEDLLSVKEENFFLKQRCCGVVTTIVINGMKRGYKMYIAAGLYQGFK